MLLGVTRNAFFTRLVATNDGRHPLGSRMTGTSTGVDAYILMLPMRIGVYSYEGAEVDVGERVVCRGEVAED